MAVFAKLRDLFASSGLSGVFLRYVLAFFILFASFYLRRLVDLLFERFIARLVARTRFHLDDLVFNAASKPAAWAAVAAGVYFSLKVLGYAPRLSNYSGIAAGLLILVFLLRFIDRLAEYLKPHVHKTETSLDDAVLPAMRTAAKVFVVIIISLWVMDTLGWKIQSVLAGLGIGGLAVALAAQTTLSNWFGAFMIFADRPFLAGQIVSVGDVTGTVEQVGLRSTNIRTFDGTLVTIPNSTVANSKIDNISRMPGRRFKGSIGVTYDTSADKLEQALTIVRGILDENPRVKEGFLACFDGFGAYSLDLQVVYVTDTVDYKEFMAIKEGINLAILRAFNAAGIEFAFPTQTLFVKNS